MTRRGYSHVATVPTSWVATGAATLFIAASTLASLRMERGSHDEQPLRLRGALAWDSTQGAAAHDIASPHETR